jgi:uncharacterized DUF497 family protein
MSLRFEWDEDKNKANRKKHGIWFETAKNAFDDPYGRLLVEDTSAEDRFILIGASADFSLLIIVHLYKENDEVIRIISARRATKNERRFYEEGI